MGSNRVGVKQVSKGNRQNRSYQINQKVKHRRRKQLRKTVFLGLVCFLLIVLGVAFYFLRPQVVLKGGKNVSVNVYEEYKEKGYQAKFLGKNYQTKVSVKGEVNTKKLGVYDIVYSYPFGFLKIKATRHVSVVDKEAPKLTLKGEKETYICKNGEYKEEGYEAEDNYDGDLSKKVKVSKQNRKGIITYTVSDTSGNETKVERKIIEKDVSGPEITLEGDETVYLILGNSYDDPGAKAIDNCDGDVSSSIEVDNPVDTSTAGTYEVTYKAKDSLGNETTKVRKVIITYPKRTASYNGIAGNIYLTFDDGPSWNTTPTILDILKEEGVKATFFVIYHEGTEDLLKRIVDEGHTLALHSYTHDYSIYSSESTYFNDLNAIHDFVYNATGVDTHFIRFPGGSSNTISRRYCDGIMSTLTNEVLNRGFKYFDWNVTSGDAGETTSASGVYQNVTQSLSLERVNMVLMHDIKTYTRDAVRDIIRYGKENGYHFAKIDDSTEMVTHKVAN